MNKFYFCIFFVVILCFLPATTNALISDGKADMVLGQFDFTHNFLLNGQEFGPYNVAIDTMNNRLYACDYWNNRVLWWNNITTITNGQTPDGVLGQTDLFSSESTCTQTGLNYPSDICIDGSGNIWVADTGNNRVLKYTTPSSNGQAATLVLGQPNFTTKLSSYTQTGFDTLSGLGIDSSGNVWVADGGGCRVLKYITPSSNGQTASLVLGQNNFTSKVSACTQSGLTGPKDVGIDGSDNVWVVEEGGRRILKYNAPTSNGQAASLVLGQSNFTSNNQSCSQTGLYQPMGLCVDKLGNIWVSDNFRVLKYITPSSNGQAASLVLGQSDFTLSVVTCTQTGVYYTYGLSIDDSGNIWVADGGNSRLLRYSNPSSNGQAANLVLGHSDFTHKNPVCYEQRIRPYSIAKDNTSGRIYVCDYSKNRILWWNNSTSLSNGQQADGVIGQTNFTAISPACTQTGLGSYSGGPTSVAVDTSGNVWVVDFGNNRVLKYTTPSSNGQAASLVLGQTNFSSKVYACTQTGLGNSSWGGPFSVTVDISGNVWVADCYNNRILKYTTPSTNGQAATLVLGQTDFISGVATCTQTGLGKSGWGNNSTVTVDKLGNIWVADKSNNRILKYTTPSSNGQAASLVLGQPDYIHNSSTCTQAGLNNPSSVSIDESGNLWVADLANNRILKYTTPANNGQAASLVLGQTNFASDESECTLAGMYTPCGVTADNLGNIWIADTGNNRVLEYKVSASNGDSTLPTNIATVNDGTGTDVDSTNSTNQLSANWMASSDPESGIAKYYYAIGTTLGGLDIAGWTATANGSITSATKSNLTLVVGTTYYFTVKAENSVGLQSGVTNSNGQYVQPGSVATYLISGFLRTSGNVGISDVTVTLTSGTVNTTATTASDGSYTFSSLISANYTVTPTKTGYTFTPASLAFANLSSDQTSQNFIGKPPQTHDYTSFNETVVYPNPLSVKTGHKMSFNNLPANTELNIYTLSGKLVCNLNEAVLGNGVIDWSGKNSDGKTIVPGVYVYVLKALDGQKKTGKVAVIH